MRESMPHGQPLLFRHRPRAQAMVEFALALPVFLLLVYGLLEVGRLVFMYSAVTTSSREAVRYASAWGNIDTLGNQQYQDCAGIRNAARQVGFLINLSDANIHIQYDDETPPQTPPPTLHEYCLSTGPAIDTTVHLNSGDRVVVTVNSSYTPVLPLLIPLTFQNISSGPSGRTILGQIDLNTPVPTTPP